MNLFKLVSLLESKIQKNTKIALPIRFPEEFKFLHGNSFQLKLFLERDRKKEIWIWEYHWLTVLKIQLSWLCSSNIFRLYWWQVNTILSFSKSTILENIALSSGKTIFRPFYLPDVSSFTQSASVYHCYTSCE